MNTMEKILIACACLVVLIVTIVGIVKSKKSKPKTEAKQPEVKPEPAKQEKPEQKQPEKQPLVFEGGGYSPDDFKDYLKEKNDSIKKPVPKAPLKGFNLSERFLDRPSIVKEKNLSDDICCLSPEVQAMIFAGLLDRKF